MTSRKSATPTADSLNSKYRQQANLYLPALSICSMSIWAIGYGVWGICVPGAVYDPKNLADPLLIATGVVGFVYSVSMAIVAHKRKTGPILDLSEWMCAVNEIYGDGSSAMLKADGAVTILAQDGMYQYASPAAAIAECVDVRNMTQEA